MLGSGSVNGVFWAKKRIYNICGFSAEQWFEYISIQMNFFIIEKYILEMRGLSCLTWNFELLEFDLDLWTQSQPGNNNSSRFSVPASESPHFESCWQSNFYWLFYIVPFLRYFTSKFRLTKVKYLFTIRKPIQDFLSNFHWRYLSISYSFQDIWLSQLRLKKLYHSKARIWLPIWLLWTPSLYIVPFSRKCRSKF